MITIEQITNQVCEALNIDADKVREPCRIPKYASTRYVIMKIAREHKIKLKTIGAYLGGKDHSAVISGIRKLEIAVASKDNLHNLYYTVRRRYNLIIDSYEKCKVFLPIKYTVNKVIAPKVVSVRINQIDSPCQTIEI